MMPSSKQYLLTATKHLSPALALDSISCFPKVNLIFGSPVREQWALKNDVSDSRHYQKTVKTARFKRCLILDT